MDKKGLNRITLSILAPLLILVGVAGFLVPSQYSLTSDAAPYNLFHILFGALGMLILSLRKVLLICFFNLSFGLIDLYQAFASVIDLTPKQYFLWTPLDDFLHVVLGFALVIIGFQGFRQWREEGP